MSICTPVSKCLSLGLDSLVRMTGLFSRAVFQPALGRMGLVVRLGHGGKSFTSQMPVPYALGTKTLGPHDSSTRRNPGSPVSTTVAMLRGLPPDVKTSSALTEEFPAAPMALHLEDLASQSLQLLSRIRYQTTDSRVTLPCWWEASVSRGSLATAMPGSWAPAFTDNLLSTFRRGGLSHDRQPLLRGPSSGTAQHCRTRRAP